MRRYSRKKKLLLSIILLVFSIVMVEAGAHLLYAILEHQLFPFRSYDVAIHRIAAPSEPMKEDRQSLAGERKVGRDSTAVEVIHPYLGFVLDPNKTPDVSYLGLTSKNDDPLVRKNGSSITVAVFGGSVAKGTADSGELVMRSILLNHGINARILTIALAGYKQPQQLFALAYLLSHGAQFDVVVNIDGFNEVALPQAENIPKGVNPFYPRAWYSRTISLDDQLTLRNVGRVLALQDDRQQWAALFRSMPKFSIIRNLVWKAYDRWLERQIMDINDQIRQSQSLAASRFLTTGPDMGIEDETELYRKIANHWKTCSLLMKALCDSRGITYIHILQPNQYFGTGRILTEREKKNAFREDQPYRTGVVKGYPRLLEAKNDLIAQDVNFHDLTKVYDGIPQPIYIDDCCHPNRFGYNIIAKYIAHEIIDVMDLQAAEKLSRKTLVPRAEHRP